MKQLLWITTFLMLAVSVNAYELNVSFNNNNNTVLLQHHNQQFLIDSSDNTSVFLELPTVTINNTVVTECVTNNYKSVEYHNNTVVNNVTYALDCPAVPDCSLSCPEFDYSTINLIAESVDNLSNSTSEEINILKEQKKKSVIIILVMLIVFLFCLSLIMFKFLNSEKDSAEVKKDKEVNFKLEE